MPIEFAIRTHQPGRLAAWRAHYIAKGCSQRKAGECADRKRHGITWPPVDTL